MKKTARVEINLKVRLEVGVSDKNAKELLLLENTFEKLFASFLLSNVISQTRRKQKY